MWGQPLPATWALHGHDPRPPRHGPTATSTRSIHAPGALPPLPPPPAPPPHSSRCGSERGGYKSFASTPTREYLLDFSSLFHRRLFRRPENPVRESAAGGRLTGRLIDKIDKKDGQDTLFFVWVVAVEEDCAGENPFLGRCRLDRSGIGSFIWGREGARQRRRPTDPTQPNQPVPRPASRIGGGGGAGGQSVARMAGSMQAADAAVRLSALLSLLALRRLLAVLQPLALLLLLPFRWRPARPGAVATAAASDAAASASGPSGKKGKASASSVVLRVPAGSPMVAARRQASARREVAMRRAREAGREYELIPTARGETLFTQCWWPHPPSSAIKPR